jgi:peptidylprolyl isomerase
MTRLLALLFAAVLLAGCGSDTGSNEAATDGSESTPAATASAAPAAPVATGPISKNLKEEPKIPKPSGAPPTTLVKKDIVVGKGPKAKSGDTLSVQYTGVKFSDGKKFDASWDRGAEPFQFPVGGGQVIPGWDQGIPGMRVGGRRELIIPSDLAYGAQGSPPTIGPNETLIFVVDLVKIG